MGVGPSVPNADNLNNSQTQSNIATATAQTGLNAMNQQTPFGNLSYSQIGTWPDGTPRFQASTTFSPQMQQLFNTNMGTQQQIGNAAQSMAGGISNNLEPINSPQYQNYGGGPNLATQGGYRGNLTSNVNPGQIRNTISNAGQIQRNLGVNDYGAQRDEVENALMGRLNQSYDQDRSALEQRLASQGITQGSEAYTNAMGDFNRSLAEARTSTVLGAGQEQNRLQQLALNAGNFANAAQAQQYGQNANNAAFFNNAQNQQFQQALANAGLNNAAQQQQYQQTLGNAAFENDARQQMFDNRNAVTGANNNLQTQQFQNAITGNNQNINQLLALLGGSQIQQPQFGQTPQTGIPGTDVSGNAWNQYNAQQGQSNQFWNGLGALGGTAASILPFLLSDKRAKTDIKDTGMRTPGGVPIKDWRYKGSPMMQRGYIAQDVVKSGQGNAVAKTPGGFLAVDYRRVA